MPAPAPRRRDALGVQLAQEADEVLQGSPDPAPRDPLQGPLPCPERGIGGVRGTRGAGIRRRAPEGHGGPCPGTGPAGVAREVDSPLSSRLPGYPRAGALAVRGPAGGAFFGAGVSGARLVREHRLDYTPKAVSIDGWINLGAERDGRCKLAESLDAQ